MRWEGVCASALEGLLQGSWHFLGGRTPLEELHPRRNGMCWVERGAIQEVITVIQVGDGAGLD